MDRRRLESFVVLAQELNFTRAARRLHVTQSTLSASTKSLETELGVTLLARSTRAVALTEAGRAFLPAARGAIEALDVARASVEPGRELEGTLTVGSLQSLGLIDIPALAGDFHRRHPRVRLQLQTSTRGTAGLVEGVKQNRVDVAFVGAALTDRALQVTAIRSFHPQLVVPSDHRLAGRRHVTLADLADESFVDMPPGFGQREVADEAFARQSLVRTVLVEVADVTTIARFVAHGLGVALLPVELTTEAGSSLISVPVTGADLSWTLGAVVSATHPPSRAVRVFLDLVSQHRRPEKAF